MAIRDSLSVVIEVGFGSIIVEADSWRVFAMLQAKEERSEVGLICNEIQIMAT